MTRAARVSIELLTPPLLGSSPFLLMSIITGTFGLIPVVLLVAYVVAIVPSLIFTGLMELARSASSRRPARWTASARRCSSGRGRRTS